MKIIEAMKLRKRLVIKAGDLRKKISTNCAGMEDEEPAYKEPMGQIKEWLQSHFDIVQLMGELAIAIQKTNLDTEVTIVLGEKEVTKSLAEWVLRRRELANMDKAAWQGLGDRGLQPKAFTDKTTNEPVLIKIKRFFDPKLRDAMVELYTHEPSRIDAKLETVNATTDLTIDVKVDEDKLV